MVKALLCPALVLSFSGCIYIAKPIGDRGYAQAKRLRDFEGCYQNVSDPTRSFKEERRLVYLIWPSETKAYGADSVLIRSFSREQLEVSAFQGTTVLSSGTYTLGKEFWMEGGHLKLKTNWHAFTDGGDDPIAGPRFRTTTLGIDPNGNGRSVQKGGIAGMVFLIFPVAWGGEDVGRYRRNDALCGRTP